MRPLPENQGPGLAPAWWPHVRASLRRRRRFILTNWITVTVLVVIASLLLPRWYTARSILLPPSDSSDISLGFSALLRGGDLASGRLPRTTTTEDLFTAILTSRTLAREAVRHFDLVSVYHVKKENQAIERFQKHVEAGTTKEGMVYVAVEDRDPQRAADLTNFLVDQLDLFNRDTRMTAGRSAREFIQRRLDETQATLRHAEDSLKAYQTRQSLPLTGESAAAGGEVMAQKIALSVRLQTLLQTQSEASDEVRKVKGQLEALDAELARLPQAGTQMSRLMREVKIQDQVYTLLTTQLEEAKVREHKDTPTVQSLDRADRPDHKSRPRRGLIVLTGAVLALGESLLVALYTDRRRPGA